MSVLDALRVKILKRGASWSEGVRRLTKVPLVKAVFIFSVLILRPNYSVNITVMSHLTKITQLQSSMKVFSPF